jgi:hypothetical protein
MRIASCSSYTDNRLHIRFLLIEHVRIPYGDPLSADAAAFVPPTFGLAEIPVALPARDDDDGVRPSWPYLPIGPIEIVRLKNVRMMRPIEASSRGAEISMKVELIDALTRWCRR